MFSNGVWVMDNSGLSNLFRFADNLNLRTKPTTAVSMKADTISQFNREKSAVCFTIQLI
jgi:hypothetical protein